MRKRTVSRVFKLCIWSAALTPLWLPVSAPAQANPPQPAPTLKSKKPWFQWLAGVGIIGIICIAAFKNPKRGSHG